MDFPHSQFPGLYNEGPCINDTNKGPSALGWGQHAKIQPTNRSCTQARHSFIPLYSRRGERWIPCEPAPVPLFPPNTDCGFPEVTESDLVYAHPMKRTRRCTNPNKSMVTLDFSKQMGDFYWGHNDTGFQCMGRLLEPHCYMGDKFLRHVSISKREKEQAAFPTKKNCDGPLWSLGGISQCDMEPPDSPRSDASDLALAAIQNIQHAQPEVATPSFIMDSLKSLLDKHHASFTAQMAASTAELKKEISSTNERIDSLERRQEDAAVEHSNLQSFTQRLADYLEVVDDKIADLEDRSRRNNLRIRGIPETISPADLQPYLKELFQVLAPPATELEALMDRAHRALKPRGLSDDQPRDTIVRLHYFTYKERIQRAHFQKPPLPEKFKNLQIFPDLSVRTLQKRKTYAEITSILRRNEIRYRWGYPIKLLIFRNNQLFTVQTSTKGYELLKMWNLYPPQKDKEKPQARHSQLSASAAEWTDSNIPAGRQGAPEASRPKDLSTPSARGLGPQKRHDALEWESLDPQILIQIEATKAQISALELKRHQNQVRLFKQTFYAKGNKADRLLANKLRQRTAEARIPYIKTSQGTVRLPADIGKAFASYYSKLYNLVDSPAHQVPSTQHIQNFLDTLSLPTLTVAQIELLEAPFSAKEVLSVIKSLKPHKAPGPDGYGALFYKTFHLQLAPLLTRVCSLARQSGTLPSELLQAIIVTIPKPGKTPNVCEHFRPISLINADVKLMAKLMAFRLNLVLPSLLDGDQTIDIVSSTYCGFPEVTESDLVYAHPMKRTRRCTNPNKSMVTLDFSKQMGDFYWGHNDTAFQCMGRLLEPHCYMGDKFLRGRKRENVLRMTTLLHSLQHVPYRECPYLCTSTTLRCFSFLAGDWLSDLPPVVLGQLLHKGISEQWRQLQFQESLTGGALAWTKYTGSQRGCLIYPRGAAMNRLYFQQFDVGQDEDLSISRRGDTAVFDLISRVQQVSTGCAYPSKEVFVGVRSSFHLASLSLSPQNPPRVLQVVNTKTPSTCINVSPHLPGELCVCTEGGSLYLWDTEMGLQQVRHESDTLFFRDDHRWRWSDFTGHPRILTYADRTGVQTTDTRAPGSQGLNLFRIGAEALCQTGERVILPRYVREGGHAQHLIVTQFSVFIMDERFPLVPVLKWDHMLDYPPAYAQVLPGTAVDRSMKILLGTQHSQETVMIQYTGGSSSPCQLLLPALKLSQVSECLAHHPPLLPHKHDLVEQRLNSVVTGLAATYSGRHQDSMVVFHLTEAGDVFYQRLVHQEKEETAKQRAQGGQQNVTILSAPASRTEMNLQEHNSSTSPNLVPKSTPCAQEPAAENEERIPSATFPTHEEETCEPDLGCHHPPHLQSLSLSTKSLNSLSRWLQELTVSMKEVYTQRPRVRIDKFFSASELREVAPDSSSLLGCLRHSMRHRKLVRMRPPVSSVHLEPVHPKYFKDPLSQRLTTAWEGGLHLWWEDYLGLNKSSKIQALKEKRRWQKIQRARHRRSLSGSFGSSQSLCSEPYSLEDAPLSDNSTIQYDFPSSRAPSTFTSSVEQESVGSSTRAPSGSVLATHKRFSIQDRVGESASQLKTLKTNIQDSSQSSAIFSSQSLRSKGIPRERRKTVLDFLSFLGDTPEPPFSASLIPSQNSQTQVTSSQSSQVPRKRSRMGF
ncbi:TATA box-binding protein-associated factor RNA polymerase I subunit C [Bombina bombina]|uniref:TATA box-binding protein-associated factor RNA polymerase I subunit C n=1 Tax=Bombina bombina TaxID=8345 RepID=UPI00235B044D|nr:TATA box-binding protein-associated factor RNA polymerase I subunit C [Bombina bombina]